MPGRVADVLFGTCAVVVFRLAESVWAIRNLPVDSLVCIVIVWLAGLLELLNLLEAAECIW